MSPLELRPFILMMSFVVAGPLAIAQDDPDLKREERFFNNYSNFNSQPTSEESWAGVTSGKAQSYTVQGGDTLWGLSETLFGDPNYWPKIWSLNNEEIGNPHEILPSQEVRFFAGTMGEAPSLAVGEGGEAASAAVETPAAKDPLAGVELPEPKKKSTPLSGLPGSMPKWDYRKDRKTEVVMELQKINRDFGSPDEVLTYYVSETELTGLGEIKETEMGMTTAAEFQYVFVKLPTVPSEKKLMVIKSIGNLEDNLSDKEGSIIQVQGEIEVMEQVNAEEQLYRALVKRVISPIEVGAKLVVGELPMYNSRDEGAGGTAKARVVGGQFNVKRAAFGTSNIVFLSGQGLTAGQSYPVYKVQTLRVPKSDGIQNPRVIGRVKVVNVGTHFATGVVLNSTDDVRVGDVTDPTTATE